MLAMLPIPKKYHCLENANNSTNSNILSRNLGMNSHSFLFLSKVSKSARKMVLF